MLLNYYYEYDDASGKYVVYYSYFNRSEMVFKVRSCGSYDTAIEAQLQVQILTKYEEE